MAESFPNPSWPAELCLGSGLLTVALAGGVLWLLLDRRRLARELILAAARYRTFFEHGEDGIVILDPATTRIIDFNDQACRQLGYTREEFARLSLADLEVQETPTGSMEHVRRIVAQGHDDFETLQRTKSGEVRNVHVTARDIRTPGTEIYHCIWRDITEQKRAESAEARSRESLASLFEHAVMGLYRTSMQGRIMMANQAMCRMFGYASLEELAGCRLEENPTYDVQRFRRELEAHSKVEGLESQWTKPSGEVVTLRESARLVRDASGNPLYFEGIVEDVTELKRAEEEKARLQAQLVQSQKMESLGQLAGGVAHDMNNVLGAILFAASAQRQEEDQDSAAWWAFDMITQAATRGGEMVKSLLGLARQSPGEMRELDLNLVLGEELRLLERTTLSRIRLELELDPALGPVRGDGSLLAHAFMNLCINAVDAMSEGGTLTLRTRNVEGRWAEVHVEDTGTGMPKEVLDKAMDPFFTTKEVGKGTGLGLSMVYGTVNAHNGQMEIRSEPGCGTQVVLRFPVSEAQVPEPASEGGPGPLTESRRLHVLLVDDDELIRRSMAALSATGRLDVTPAACGEDALILLEGGLRPDAVILDMNMPGLGGQGTLPRLRELCPQVPVLLATGRADQTAQTLAGTHAGVSLLPKPFSHEALLRRLGELCPAVS